MPLVERGSIQCTNFKGLGQVIRYVSGCEIEAKAPNYIKIWPNVDSEQTGLRRYLRKSGEEEAA